MPPATISARHAGIAGMVAAALILATQAVQLGLPLTMPESFWIATQTLRMGLAIAAMFALVVALAAMYARFAPSMGRNGLLGYLLASLGTLLVAGDWWYEAFIGPVLRQQAPELLATAPGGTILLGAVVTVATFAAGWTIFGVALMRARVVPNGAAALVIVGGIAGSLALIAPFQVPLALAVGWIGLNAVRSDARAGREPAPAPVAA
jgi:hypothetical protein